MTNRSLVLLSGERSSIPRAEAEALFLAYDPATKFESPESRVLLAEGSASPGDVARRVAFSRRVGLLLTKPTDAAEQVKGKKVGLRAISIGAKSSEGLDIRKLMAGLDAEVDLDAPDFEFTLVRGEEDYLMLSQPSQMRQGWSLRRPRKRPFFHPSAIFPKLSRALINLTGCLEGEVFLDPFAGTGSLVIEAASIGLRSVASDESRKMTRGSLANMKGFAQDWLGVLRADAFTPPFRLVDGIATDVPYGRVSSTRGKATGSIVETALEKLSEILRPGGRLVLMHPELVKVPETQDLIEEAQHNIYVHRKLTRAITVLRRR